MRSVSFNGLRKTALLFAWQVQNLAAPNASFCVAGAALRAPDAAFARCSTRRAWPLPVVNGLRGTAHHFAWQAQFTWCTATAASCFAGAALREPGRCLWSTVSAGPRTFCRWQVQHLVHRRLLFAWQVQHLESLGVACGQRSPRDRAPFCVAGAALGAPDAAFAWQVQHLESLGAACGQRSPRDRAPFCVAGAALSAPSLGAAWALVNGLRGGPRTPFAWQVQHLVHRMLLLRGRCST